jgi:hypothetical protein
MKRPDSDDRERALQPDDIIVVPPEDCADAYLEFSSETTLPSPVTRSERREFDSDFLSEDDPDFLDRVSAQVIAEDDWGLTSEGEAGEGTALTITASSSSVVQAGLGANVRQSMRARSRIILAVATVVGFATGAVAVRVVLGPPNARTVTRVTELPPAPQPPAIVRDAQAAPAVRGAASLSTGKH